MINTLASGGFNVVRLGTMWTGFEPEKGQINQSYVDILKVSTQQMACYNSNTNSIIVLTSNLMRSVILLISQLHPPSDSSIEIC